jgi:hypothetical protein
MLKSSATLASILLGATVLAGCSSDGSILPASLTTQSISTSPTTVAATPKIDPACYSIAQRIEVLRKDGLTERLEKAAAGKSSNVSVKRASLQQAAELDKANAEFQAKCSTLGVRPPIQATAQPVQGGAVATSTAVAPVVNSSQVVSANAPKAAIAPPVVQQSQ